MSNVSSSFIKHLLFHSLNVWWALWIALVYYSFHSATRYIRLSSKIWWWQFVVIVVDVFHRKSSLCSWQIILRLSAQFNRWYICNLYIDRTKPLIHRIFRSLVLLYVISQLILAPSNLKLIILHRSGFTSVQVCSRLILFAFSPFFSIHVLFLNIFSGESNDKKKKKPKHLLDEDGQESWWLWWDCCKCWILVNRLNFASMRGMFSIALSLSLQLAASFCHRFLLVKCSFP